METSLVEAFEPFVFVVQQLLIFSRWLVINFGLLMVIVLNMAVSSSFCFGSTINILLSFCAARDMHFSALVTSCINFININFSNVSFLRCRL